MRTIQRFMNEALARVSVPICGVALGVMGLANICRIWSQEVAWVFCALSVFLLALYVSRCIHVRGSFRRDLGSPVTACVFGTFPMTVIFLAGHIADLGVAADAVFILGSAIQLVLIVYIAVSIIPKMRLSDVHACLFVPLVGIAAMGASGASVGLQQAGEFGAVLGLALSVPVLVAVAWRYFRLPDLAPAEAPVFCILAAPFALCTVAISGSVPDAPIALREVVYAAGLVLYMVVIARVPSLMRAGFVPSKASMGFPMTVSAVATHSMSVALKGTVSDILTALFLAQVIVAVAVMAHILAGYIGFLSPAGSE